VAVAADGLASGWQDRGDCVDASSPNHHPEAISPVWLSEALAASPQGGA
jgi:hypothetical protein